MAKNFSNAPPSVFNDSNYIHYVVEYQGNIIDEASKSSILYITIINKKYAVISIPYDYYVENGFTQKNNPFPSIVYISRYYMYTLQEIQTLSPIVAANINLTQIQPPFYLTGKGVIVGIIDTGIDYLNKEFIDSNGNTRILNIWDQTVSSPTSNNLIPFGSIYTSSDINNAIKASKDGKDPYSIVPSKDTIGHGTAMSGIIGANGINPELRGAAPDCEFVVVKITEATTLYPLLTPSVPVYDRAALFFAINYLYQYALSTTKPIVIYLPLGTTFSNHNGDGILEDFINELSTNKGVAVVTGSGNEANTGGHTSGKILKKGNFQDIQLYISPEQTYLITEIWINKPNIMSINIISSSGEDSGVIPAFLNQKQTNKFIFENTTVTVTYFIPDELSGDELIVVEMKNLQAGTWKFRLVADYVLDGTYNAWLLPKGITKSDTKFISPDPYGTLTSPSASQFIITASSYNQNNYNIVNSSGMAFLNDVKDKIDVAAGGVNVQTIGPNNEIRITNGTSISAAVVAGASAIMFQWGVIDGNDPDIYSQKLKAYLTRGTSRRMNDIYPNAEWGYGVLDMIGVFKYLE